MDVPHFFTLLLDKVAMGIDRTLFVAALRAEGIPVGTGYSRPMYAAPTFLKKIAFGRDGWPWNWPGANSNVRYEKGMCPTSERLLSDEFLWFYHIAYSSTEDDMREIGHAVRKVVNQRDALAAEAHQLTDRIGCHSAGRIGVAPQHLKKG